jgi:C-terminal processing protease CtpA/Prc
MKQTQLYKLISLVIGIAISLPAVAWGDQDSPVEAQAKSQASANQAAEAKMEAGYQNAMAEANRSQAEAQAALAEARKQLELASKKKQQAKQVISEEQRAEMEAMREKLTRAQRELRETSRELSQINREIIRVERDGTTREFIFRGGNQPVLGVALGDTSDTGVRVLSVSPNGPAEKAGLQPGDVIIAIGGRVLGDGGNARSGLNTALNDIEASTPVIVSVDRGAETLDLTIIPEVREPLTWQTVTRFPTAPVAPVRPAAPGAPSAPTEVMMVERIVVPEIDHAALAGQIAQMEAQIEQLGGSSANGAHWISDEPGGYEFYFGDMSELGDIALSDTSAWFGMPLTAGLRLAQIDPALGEYFDTNRGVLVLKAEQDNALLLQTGDVVLMLDRTEVNTPADFMRALREFTPGDAIQIDIKRKLKNQTLSPVISDKQARLFMPQEFEEFEVVVNSGD